MCCESLASCIALGQSTRATRLEMSREASAPDLGGRKGTWRRTAVELLYRDFPINSTYRYRYLMYGNYYIGMSLRIVPTSIGTSDLQSHPHYLEVHLYRGGADFYSPVTCRPTGWGFRRQRWLRRRQKWRYLQTNSPHHTVCTQHNADICAGFYIGAFGMHNCVGKSKAVLSHTWGIGDKVTMVVNYGKATPSTLRNQSLD
jgi:hypothetical protein